MDATPTPKLIQSWRTFDRSTCSINVCAGCCCGDGDALATAAADDDEEDDGLLPVMGPFLVRMPAHRGCWTVAGPGAGCPADVDGHRDGGWVLLWDYK